MKNTAENNTKKSIWIMDCEPSILRDTLSRTLETIDNYQQKCVDWGLDGSDLEELYNEMEKYYHKIIQTNTISIEERNEIRMTCKHLIKAYSHLN